MRNFTTILLLFLVINAYSQNESLKINYKKKFVPITSINDSVKKTLTEKIIIDNDTLLNINETNEISTLFSKDFFKDEKIIQNYKAHAFGSSYDKSKYNRDLMQWVTPIVVYIDKSLPSKIKSQFVTFINQLKGVNNLSISITKNINEANYHISLVEEKVTAYTYDDLELYSDFEKEERTYIHMTYQLLVVSNRIFGNILKINKASTKSDINTIGKLKKVFFTTLGQFSDSYRTGNGSLIAYSNNYVNNDTVSPYDLKILKMHYHTIYDFNMNIITFNSIEKLIKNED